MAIQLHDVFIQQLQAMLPGNEAQKMADAIIGSDPVVAVRFNSSKGFDVPAHLEPVPWCPSGAYLPERPQFTFDPHFHAGSYYVQDPSSMFIHHVISSLITKPVKYLDLCAAPGGKTTTALQALPKGSVMVANEIVPQRAQVLRENVIKWGADNCLVTCDSPRNLAGNLMQEFDVIAADVPCSGEGMFRKDDEAIAQWAPALVEQCAARTRTILADVWPCLKPGGLLIYSTCTYNNLENEQIVEYIINSLGATAIPVSIQPQWNIHGAIGSNYPCYRFLPHLTRGEGLFMCVLRKNDGLTTLTPSAAKDKNKKNTLQVPPIMNEWIAPNFQLSALNGTVIAINSNIKESLKNSLDKLHVIKPLGIELGTIKGKKFLPSHALAMSPCRAGDAFPSCEIDYRTAIAYLRGEAITIDAPKSHVLLTYHGAALGFVNNLGNRANNLYPKSWRIMSTHAPAMPPHVVI